MNFKPRFDNAFSILLIAGVGCFVLSFIAMGLAPWTSLKHVIKPVKTAGNPYVENGQLTSIGRGRKIYIREACWHCHSQFVRPVAGESFRYGPVSQAWEGMYDIPHTYGTRRIGPDLSRQAGRHSDDWHFAHLYNPRNTVPLSVMPAYHWFFEKTADGIKPSQEAKDLVAYLQNLGSSFQNEIKEVVYPRLFKVSGRPEENPSYLSRGFHLFQENCTGCHGNNADGKGRASSFLKPPAANLVRRYISPSEVYSILNRGVYGSAMPSFREMPEQDLWAIALYVSSLGKETQKQALSTYKLEKNAMGKNIYMAKCMACHGEKGTGESPVASALNPRPKDFTRRLFTKDYLREIVLHGVEGSAMPAFSGLTEDELEALGNYIAGFYDEKL